MNMTIKASRHNLVGQLHGSESWYVVNPLSRQAAILDTEHAAALNGGPLPDDPKPLLDAGFLVDPGEEESRLRDAYLDFLKGRNSDEVQLLFAVTFACNFGCSYCFQESYCEPIKGDAAVAAAFWSFVDQRLAGRRTYLTLFGGEPLLPPNMDLVGALVDGAARRGIDVAVVTNGFHLEESLDVLTRAHVREIQITLDGPQGLHDQRRPLKGGQPTFERVVRNIDLAIERGIPVNLRVVVDRDNLSALPELARLAVQRGWTRAPGFKTQLGRNYELHTCQVGGSRLYSRLELYQDLTKLIEQYPEILEFHRPAYHVARFLFDSGELPEPLFDSCPGCKTEWAFDAAGNVYPCTANVGKPGEAIGTFHPSIRMNEDEVEAWEDRDTLAIDKCRTCSVQLVCGGGCAEVARNQTGSLHSPDCRPAAELVDLGMNLYFKPSDSE